MIHVIVQFKPVVHCLTYILRALPFANDLEDPRKFLLGVSFTHGVPWVFSSWLLGKTTERYLMVN